MHPQPQHAIRCNKQTSDIYDAEEKFITYSRAHVLCTGHIYITYVWHLLVYYARLYIYIILYNQRLWWYMVVLVMDSMAIHHTRMIAVFQ